MIQPGDRMLVRYNGYERVECEVVKCDGVWTDIIWLSDDQDGDRYSGMEIRSLTEKLYREGDEVPTTALEDIAEAMLGIPS